MFERQHFTYLWIVNVDMLWVDFLIEPPTITKTICSNILNLFRGGLKFDPLLQMARNFYSSRLAPKNVFLGADHLLTRPYK